jgi:hypothetical protein
MNQSFKTFLTEIIEKGAQNELKAKGKISPMAFFGSMSTDTVESLCCMELDFRSPDTKAFSLDVLRHAIASVGANYVVVITESWTLQAEDQVQWEKVYEQYGSIANSPNKKEALMIAAQTTDGAWMAIPELISKGKRKCKTLGNVTYFQAGQDGVEFRGQFSNLLPKGA